MTADWADVTVGLVSALASIGVLIVAYWQLKNIATQIKIQGERERKWATVKEVSRYTADPIIYEASRRVWQASDKGTDYRNYKDIDIHDVIVYLNYLEGIAVGIEQGLFIEEIVRDNLGDSVVPKSVKVFLKGESGPTWKVDEPLFKRHEEYEFLRNLYKKWSEVEPRSDYQDTDAH